MTCPLCNDTGYKDHASMLCLDPCGHGEGVEARVPSDPLAGMCDCHTCAKARCNADPVPGIDMRMQRYFLCPICGNKRCPRATDHRHECTGSNEPGQKGSRYE